MARRSDHTRPELTQLALDTARAIVSRDGISALSSRKVATKIGYTVGTLYQIFDDMDDLVERLNAQTLAELYKHCRAGEQHDDIADKLQSFGLLFMEFVRENANAWDAVMSYRYKDDHTTSDFYHHEILKLFGLMEGATQEFYGPEQKDEHAADMAMLWASLTGILGVANSERNVGGPLEEMLSRLIKMYLASRSQ